MTFYHRKSTRIPNYDYSLCNYYFITICTHNRKCLFGLPNRRTKTGAIAENQILQIAAHYPHVKVDNYVVMPNHVHMIVVLQDHSENPNLNQIIGQYKSGVTRMVRELFPGMEIWQRSFHDHVIRDQRGYEKIWRYIEENPMNWNKDCFYIDETIGSAP